MSKHTISDLYQMQSLPLSAKIIMTRQRIQAWVEEYDNDGVYVSFSGGKDSTVLLDIVRKDYPDIKAVFVDTGLEYPEIRQFVKTFDNVDWLKPKMNFRAVIEKYGYPFISKEVAECVYGAKKYLENRGGVSTSSSKASWNRRICRQGGNENSLTSSSTINSLGTESTESYVELESMLKDSPRRVKAVFGVLGKDNKLVTENIPSKDRSKFNCSRYKFFLEDGAPPISHMCCSVMKKAPVHSYARKTGRKPMTAQTASESRLRTQQWLLHGCNGFDMKSPISNPMAFWTEQDVLLYIQENNLPICSVYGEVVRDYSGEEVEGQMNLSDLGIFDCGRPLLKTTGCNRTGCVFCGFGCHLEKGEGRFERLKKTHPKLYEYIMKPWDEGGLNYKEVIDWINEHGNLDIKY